MYKITLTDEAKKNYDTLGSKLQKQVDKGLARIANNPFIGKPLRAPLHGIWSERVATFRILYKIERQQVEVLVLVIEHRRHVYGGH